MKNVYIVSCLLLLLATLPTVAGDEARQRFRDIAARLDVSGDLFLVTHTGSWIKDYFSHFDIGSHVNAGMPADVKEGTISERMHRFLEEQGIGGLQGVGVSSVPQEGGHANLRVFLLRDASFATTPFWRGLFGRHPRQLVSMEFVPPDIDVVWASMLNLPALWQLLDDGHKDLGWNKWGRVLDRLSVWSQSVLQTEPLALLESLRDEVLVAARVTGEDAGSSRAWEWLVVIGADEPVLLRAMEAVAASRDETWDDIRIRREIAGRVQVVGASPEQGGLSFAVAAVPGFVMIGNSHRIVEDAVRVQRHRNGFITRPVFLDAFHEQNMINNGLVYISNRGIESLRATLVAHGETMFDHWLGGAHGSMHNDHSREAARGDFLALTLANWRYGVMISGRSGISGASMARWGGSFAAGWLSMLPEWFADVTAKYFAD